MIGVLNLAGALLSLPFVAFMTLPSAIEWQWIGVSVSVHLIYQLSLAKMMASADYSLVYPLSRGMGPLVVTVIAVIFLSEPLSSAEVTTILVLVGGAVLAGLTSGGALGKSFNNKALFWAGLVGLLIGFYTLIDGSAVKQMNPIRFIVWSNLLIMPPMMLFLYRTNGAVFTRRMTKIWQKALGMTLIAYLGYGSALYAFRFGGLAETAALRETSIIFAAVIGAVWLREHVSKVRLAGIGLIAVGAISLKLL